MKQTIELNAEKKANDIVTRKEFTVTHIFTAANKIYDEKISLKASFELEHLLPKNSDFFFCDSKRIFNFSKILFS